MKKMADDRSNVDSNNISQVPKQKERRIVSWSQEVMLDEKPLVFGYVFLPLYQQLVNLMKLD